MATSVQHTNRGKEKSTKQLAKLMQQTLAFALSEGASDAFVVASHDSGFSVDVRMGEVDTVSFNEDQGLSVTVYIGHHKGSASSTDISDSAIHMMVKAALDIARVSAPDPCFGLPDQELAKNEHPDLDLYHPWEITPKEAIELAKSCEKLALSADKRIVNSDGVSVSTYNLCHGFAHTQGGSGTVHSTRHGISCSLVAKDKTSMQRDYEYTTARSAEDLVNEEVLAKRAVERTTARLNGKRIKTQKVPILFSSRISSGLFGVFINAISGGNLYRKHSFLLDSLGVQLFPKHIQIHEMPYLLKALGSAAFDAEGVPTRNNVFVDKGVISQYALSSYSARRMGLKTTANSGGVFNLTVDPTGEDFPSLLKRLNKGLLVTELMGQGINLITGDYSRGANGFWVEKGEIQFPVEEITIAGNLRDMFRGMLAVGNDWDPNHSSRCGSVLIEEMTIAGD